MPEHVPRLAPIDWLVVLSCALLAIGVAMVGAARGGDREPSDFTITASPEGERPGAALVRNVFVDGRRIPVASIDRDAAWQVVDLEGDALFVDARERPAALRVRGRRLILTLGSGAEGGTVQVTSDDGTSTPVDCHVPDSDHVDLSWHEFPRGTPKWWLGCLAFAGLLAIAWLLRPSRTDGRARAWIAVFGLAAQLLTWLSQPVGTTVDSAAYAKAFGESLRHGENDYFPPGYSTFIAIIRGLSGCAVPANEVTLIQCGMMVVLALWLHELLRRALGTRFAPFAAAMAIATSPTILLSGRAFQSEGLTLWTVTGVMVFAARCARTHALLPAIASGTCAGIAVVTRVTPLVFVLPALVAIAWPRSRRSLQQAVAAVASMVVIVLTPMTWFLAHGGTGGLAYSSGGHLFNRVVFGGKLLDREGPATKRLLELIGDADPFARDHVTLRWAIEKAGIRTREVDRMQMRVALEAIEAHPADYVLGSLRQAAMQCWTAPETAWTGWHHPPAEGVEEPPHLDVSRAALTGMQHLVEAEAMVWPAVVIAATAGAFVTLVRRRRRQCLLLLWFILATAVSDSMLDVYSLRRSAMLAPFLIALASIGIAGWRIPPEAGPHRP